MSLACSTHFSACLLLYPPCWLLFMVFCDVFPACPAGMLPTLQEKNWGLPILIGNNQVRLVMFKQAYLLSSMVGLCL